MVQIHLPIIPSVLVLAVFVGQGEMKDDIQLVYNLEKFPANKIFINVYRFCDQMFRVQ